MQAPYVPPLVIPSHVEVWGVVFMLGQPIALIAGEYKDNVPLLYSLSYSPYITEQKPLIGLYH